MPDNAGEKKIIIDEDWKSQVAAEKEALEQGQQQPGDATKAADAAEMPQASFSMLVSMLATEAMIGLGQLPHPVTGEATAAPEHATYFIDTLGMLDEKTKGNLTPEEARMMEDLLHQLRLAFVAIQGRQGEPIEPAE